MFQYQVCTDPEDLLVDGRIVWAKQQEVRYGGKVDAKPQVIVLARGEAPEIIFVPCKRADTYNEPPHVHSECSNWEHMACKRQN